MIRLPWRRRRSSPPPRQQPERQHTEFSGGYIDRVADGVVSGWLFSEDRNAAPYVTVNGIPVTVERTGVPRPDVEAALGLTGAFGFHARLGMSVHGDADIALHAAEFERVRFVCRRTIPVCYTDGRSPFDLEAAIRISREPGAVAVVVWDAAHNPAGRAKVLYDIVATERPVVLFGFCHPEFGGALWPPLRTAAVKACLVRPGELQRFREEARAARLQFDTIWLCKPRLPTFALAETLAHPGTAFVLDIDDEEEAFSRSPGSGDRWYGATSINTAALYRDRFPVRSVASASLRQRYGGEIVRHVRVPCAAAQSKAARARSRTGRGRDGPFRLVFVGTVRPHKGLLEAARAVRLAAYRYGLDVTLTVGGIFDPPELEQALAELGVETIGVVPQALLQETLAGFDAVLTSYPGDEAYAEINRFQISSKIGDALAAGLPALVPRSPSVADLEGCPGVVLFDAGDFGTALREVATGNAGPQRLPAEFTARHAFATFERLEAAARPGRRSAAPAVPAAADGLGHVVLVWKQEDAGLYGRRVDQIARTLNQEMPGLGIHVVEFSTPTMIADSDARLRHTSHDALAAADLGRKLDGHAVGGIRYQSLFSVDPTRNRKALQGWARSFTPDEVLTRYFRNVGIHPGNAVVVVFPLVRGFASLLPCLARYPLVADIVDNQLKWSTPDKRPAQVVEYRTLADLADRVVFNSANNLEYMVRDGLVDPAKASLIPNWYLPPPAACAGAPGSLLLPPLSELSGPDVLYSGNMNGRINWMLMRETAREVAAAGGRLHLAGAAQDAVEPLRQILDYVPSCLYHGPMREADLLALAAACDFAVVPHLADPLSTYMNPIKLRMYRAIGLPHITTEVAGIEADAATTTVAATHGDFLAAVRRHIAEARRTAPEWGATLPEEARAYCALIESVAPRRRQPTAVPATVAAPRPADVRVAGRPVFGTPRSVST